MRTKDTGRTGSETGKEGMGLRRYTWSNGEMYTGDWENDNMQGKGQLYTADGEVAHAEFKDDQVVS